MLVDGLHARPALRQAVEAEVRLMTPAATLLPSTPLTAAIHAPTLHLPPALGQHLDAKEMECRQINMLDHLVS